MPKKLLTENPEIQQQKVIFVRSLAHKLAGSYHEMTSGCT